jgi:hypothetical protein
MVIILLVKALGIFLQSCLAIVLCSYFYSIFSRIDRKIRPQGINSPDLLKEIRIVSAFFLLSAIILLIITIIINLFYKSLLGFYLVSAFYLFLGFNAICPSKGRKITENCWVAPHEGRHFIVTLKDRAILIRGDWFRGNSDHMILREQSPKWLPPHEDDSISEQDYEYMLNAILKFLAKSKKEGVIKQIP